MKILKAVSATANEREITRSAFPSPGEIIEGEVVKEVHRYDTRRGGIDGVVILMRPEDKE